MREALREEWAAIAGELAAEPRVLCHRDYHSRNLMCTTTTLYVIDFQDARMGPDTYDLASLLRDSYVDVPSRRRRTDRLLRRPHLRRRADPGNRDFRRRFDMMALQRNLKALGTFGYQSTARGNPVYMQYMPRTLAHCGTRSPTRLLAASTRARERAARRGLVDASYAARHPPACRR